MEWKESGVVGMMESVMQKMAITLRLLRETVRPLVRGRRSKLMKELVGLKDEIEELHVKLLGRKGTTSESSLNIIRGLMYDCSDLLDDLHTAAKEAEAEQSQPPVPFLEVPMLISAFAACASAPASSVDDDHQFCIGFNSNDIRLMANRFREVQLADAEGEGEASSSSSSVAQTTAATIPINVSGTVVQHRLPFPLKRCFAYCAIFPPTMPISKNHLIHLWIALDFVPQSANSIVEDTGEDYFKILLKRSLFKNTKINDKGMVCFEMDPSALNQARTFAGSEIMMLQVQDSGINNNILDGVFHLLFDTQPKRLLASNAATTSSSSTSVISQLTPMVPPHLRSFSMGPGLISPLPTADYDMLFSRLTHLRALDLHDCKLDVVPHSIASLNLLRYLNLSGNHFASLPNSITSLSNLQVLDISDCKSLRKLPKHLRRLQNLRHLYLGGCDGLIGMPVGICRMTSLRTLSHFVLGKSHHFAKLNESDNLNLRAEMTIVYPDSNQQI